MKEGCLLFEQLIAEEVTQQKECPFDSICDGRECRFNGQLQPPKLVEDKKQESSIKAFLLRRKSRNN